MTTSVNASSGVNQVDLSQYDLETALMMVQSERANLLETQIKDQLETIQKRNQDIAKLNELIGNLKAARPSGTDPEAWHGLSYSWGNDDRTKSSNTRQALIDAGCTVTDSNCKDVDGNGTIDAQQKTFDVWIEQLKGKIDSLNSSQQMDMLRMQSLTNKRNEAFDLMTNFIKKMADSRSSILGNMR
ncbi:hypothetical protein [Chitinimonas lacunae]|uniref:Secreted protein n=1 Tax=Chitinimonas lacunae TaxID=1963018 RepID=A0ABV8MSR1_9NEIS